MISYVQIKAFLANNEQTSQRIDKIAENYTISDFVEVTDSIREFIDNNSECKDIRYHIYDVRNDCTRENDNAKEACMTNHYARYLYKLLLSKNEKAVFYIVAYHYLLLNKQHKKNFYSASMCSSSLIELLVGFPNTVGEQEFDYEFEKTIKELISKYKIAYSL